MARGFSRVQVDLTDFKEGFSVVDERTLRHEIRVNEDGEEVNQTLFESFDEKYGRAVESNIRELNKLLYIRKDEELIPAGELVTGYVDSQVAALRVAWDTDKTFDRDNQEEDELLKELQDELFQAIMKDINLSIKLGHRRESLRTFWQEVTEPRFQWILSLSNKLQATPNEEVGSIISVIVKKINEKMDRKIMPKEEYKLLWSVTGLLRNGFNNRFPILSSFFSPDDEAAYKDVCRAIGQHIFWSLVEKKRLDTAKDNEEPGPVYKTESEEHKYERDFNEYERMARDGSAEPWLQMMYNNFQFETDGVEKQILYRKATDSKETLQSIKTATSIANLIQNLFINGKDLHSFRINRPNHPTHNMNLPSIINYYGGKAIVGIKEVEIDNQNVKCKKYSNQTILSYHYGLCWKLYWSAWQIQRGNKTAEIGEII